MTRLLAVIALVLSGGAASADFAKLQSESDFLRAVQGKVLTRPLVRLQVGADGSIAGRGATWDVDGNWAWQGGYFCRSLNWGGDDLGYNCQEVALDGSRIRFTSDKGAGRSADFTLR
ncbi:dihydrodipicolinate reductase [Sulfitobacter sp. D35]|uniref:dihydrodipicolinate reductase n=1 Tax=Sulfitobacter sp. D35 TaxID=3083252 RepID=UPI00296EDF11|nr:dihydrodipicolinate reductase [Sulfitobacter sp. D35]MDW4498386.1 dihydrodipicolinate reductase [Sulfitobacter sp. D35]